MPSNTDDKGYLVEKDMNSLTLNMNQEAFADILLNFLGKKESLEYVNAKDSFKVTVPDLLQLDALLKQKIEKEQFTKVDNLNVNIEYNNLTSHNFNSIAKLSTYDSPNNALPISITLTWDIILKIPTNQHIEKQRISLSFNSFSMVNDRGEIPYYSKASVDSFIKLEIEYTNQSWGMEVLNLFQIQLNKLLAKESKSLKISRIIDRYLLRESLFVLLIMLSFVYNSTGVLKGELDKSKVQIDYLAKISNLKDTKEFNLYDYNLALYIIDKKNDNLSSLNSIESVEIKKILKEFIMTIDKKEIANELFFDSICLLVIFILLKVYVNQTKRFYASKSFILVTRESQKIYEEEYSNKGNIQYFSVVSLIMAILTSLIAAFIYDSFIK